MSKKIGGGLQQSSLSRQNSKQGPIIKNNTTCIQRKRSRSELAEDVFAGLTDQSTNVVTGREDTVKEKRLPFPERSRVDRKLKLDIDYDNLPSFANDIPVHEVALGCREEMLSQEKEYNADPDYLRRQPHLTARMRAVLLDWMFEVGQEYGLKRDTLHFSINFVDRYLSKQVNAVARSELQLVGVTALWIASKMEEILPPPVSDFAAATDGGCTKEQIIDLEGRMILALDWKLVPCTPYAFANLYLQSLAIEARKKLNVATSHPVDDQRSWMVPSVVPPNQLNRVMEVLDLALLDVDSLCFSPSILAASAVLSLIERDNSSFFTVRDVEAVTNCKRRELDDCLQWFAFSLDLTPGPNFAHREHITKSIPPQEVHMLQRHNPHAILLFKQVNQQRGNLRHPAADRHLLRMIYPTADDEMGGDSDEDLELRALANNGHMPLQHREVVSAIAQQSRFTRAFSPMTQISISLERTSLPNDGPRKPPGPSAAQFHSVMMRDEQQNVEKPEERFEESPSENVLGASPQRKIHFEEEMGHSSEDDDKSRTSSSDGSLSNNEN